MNKKVFNKKSKTHWATAVVASAGSLLTFLPTIRDTVPAEYYGPAILIIGVLFHVLRNVTSTSIDQK